MKNEVSVDIDKTIKSLTLKQLIKLQLKGLVSGLIVVGSFFLILFLIVFVITLLSGG